MITFAELLAANPDIVDWIGNKARWLKNRRNWFVEADDVASEALLAIVARDQKEPLSFENLNQFKGYAIDALCSKAANMLKIEHKHASVSTDSLQEQGFDVPETDKRDNPYIDEQNARIAELLPKLSRKKEREVIALSLQGLKPREIHEIRPDLGTEGAIYMLKNQATGKLRRLAAKAG